MVRDGRRRPRARVARVAARRPLVHRGQREVGRGRDEAVGVGPRVGQAVAGQGVVAVGRDGGEGLALLEAAHDVVGEIRAGDCNGDRQGRLTQDVDTQADT